MTRKLCVVTGSRAEYGLLCPLMRHIEDDSSLELQVVATGMHLSPEFGTTYQEIEKDGFTITTSLYFEYRRYQTACTIIRLCRCELHLPG